MREISAKVVGSLVLVFGASVALAAGVLLPMLGGFGGWGGSGNTAGSRATVVHAAADDSSEATSPVTVAMPLTPRPRALPMTGALASAATMPANADMVLVIEHAAELRSSPIGDAAVRFLLDASGMAQTREAWATLATQLGWTEAETFDRLLGRRVVLVARGFDDVEAARWALLSDITCETDRRLKEKLTASQRAIDQGHQILTIEKGKYELTSHRRTSGVKTSPADGSAVCGNEVTIVLGPTGRSELFDEMVGVLANGATQPLGEREVTRAAAGAGSSQVLLLARLATSAAEPDRWADFLVLSGGRTDRPGTTDPADTSEFTSRVIYRERGRTAENMVVPVSSDAAFRALAPDSLLTIVQAAPVQQVLGGAARVVDALQDIPLPEPAREYLGARQVVSLRQVRAPGAPAGANPVALSGLIALETTSTSRLAPHVDGSITRFISASELRFGLSRPPPHDFGGRLPRVTRVMPLEVPDGNPLRALLPGSLTLTWSYPSEDAIEPASGPRRSEVDGMPGWWVMCLTPSVPGLESQPESSHQAAVDALVGRAAGDSEVQPREARWIWLGAMRAAELEQRLPAVLPDIGGFRSAMRRFDDVRIELSINPAGDIQGDLSAKLAPAPGN